MNLHVKLQYFHSIPSNSFSTNASKPKKAKKTKKSKKTDEIPIKEEVLPVKEEVLPVINGVQITPAPKLNTIVPNEKLESSIKVDTTVKAEIINPPVTTVSDKPKKVPFKEVVFQMCRDLKGIFWVTVKNPSEGWRELCVYAHPIRLALREIWASCKVFWSDMKMGTKLTTRKLKGFELTRRERKRLSQAYGDAFRMVPFSIFLIVPFMEFTLPFFLMFFPNMLPSSFQTANQRNTREQKILQTRIKVAEILQDTMEHMASSLMEVDAVKKPKAQELLTIINKVRNGELIEEDKIIEISQLFHDDITLDNMPRSQIVALCKYMGTNIYGPDSMLRIQLRNAIVAIKRDDREILFEGIDSLSMEELRSACEERGMKWEGLSKESLTTLLGQWINLSITRNIPITLLILSRSFQVTVSNENLEKGLLTAVSQMTDTVVRQVVSTQGEPTIHEELIEKQRQNDLIESERKQTEEFIHTTGIIHTPDNQPEIIASSIETLEKVKALGSTSTVTIEKCMLEDMKEKQEETKPIALPKDHTLREKIEYHNANSLHNRVDKILTKIEKNIHETDKVVKPILDQNSDGIVERYEIKEALKIALNREVTDDDVKCVIETISPNKDGKVTMEELDQAIEKLKIEEDKN